MPAAAPAEVIHLLPVTKSSARKPVRVTNCQAVHAILDASRIARRLRRGNSLDPAPAFAQFRCCTPATATHLLLRSIASRLMETAGSATGVDACVSVTLVDESCWRARIPFGLRQQVSCSVALVRSTIRPKAAALARFVDALIPDRAAESRPAVTNELAATMLLRFG